MKRGDWRKEITCQAENHTRPFKFSLQNNENRLEQDQRKQIKFHDFQ